MNERMNEWIAALDGIPMSCCSPSSHVAAILRRLRWNERFSATIHPEAKVILAPPTHVVYHPQEQLFTQKPHVFRLAMAVDAIPFCKHKTFSIQVLFCFRVIVRIIGFSDFLHQLPLFTMWATVSTQILRSIRATNMEHSIHHIHNASG